MSIAMPGTVFARPGITMENVLYYLNLKKTDQSFGATQQWHLDGWVERLRWKVEFYVRHDGSDV